MILVSIGIFELNISNIIGLILGIAVGFALFMLIYLLYVLKTMNSKKYKEENSVSIEDLKIDASLKKKDLIEAQKRIKIHDNAGICASMITEYQTLFLDSRLKNGKSNIGFAKELSLSLVNNIATLYYPKSKNAYLEISVEDSMTLLRYVISRIDNTLNYGGLRFIKSIKLSTIYRFTMYKKIIDNLKITKVLKKYNITKILSGFKFIINFINPFYWVRKAIIDTSFKIIEKKLCLQSIAIIGSEAYYIYSNSVFKDKEMEEISDEEWKDEE